MAENEDTNEVIAARREEHDRKHLLDNHKGKNTIHKQLRKKIILLILQWKSEHKDGQETWKLKNKESSRSLVCNPSNTHSNTQYRQEARYIFFPLSSIHATTKSRKKKKKKGTGKLYQTDFKSGCFKQLVLAQEVYVTLDLSPEDSLPSSGKDKAFLYGQGQVGHICTSYQSACKPGSESWQTSITSYFPFGVITFELTYGKHPQLTRERAAHHWGS